jgi:general stress protein YciG
MDNYDESVSVFPSVVEIRNRKRRKMRSLILPAHFAHRGGFFEYSMFPMRRSIMASSKDKGSSDGDRNAGISKRGFASMDEEKQRAIASKGGRAAHEKGTAHEFNSEEAREAGRAAHKKGTAHKFDSEQAREAGRKGGKAAHARGTAHEFDSAEARVAGRKGGEASRSGKSGGSSANKRLFRAGDASEHRADAGRESHKGA